MPDYYPLIRAARYLGVAPWALAGAPETAGMQCWVDWALIVEGAENGAEAGPIVEQG